VPVAVTVFVAKLVFDTEGDLEEVGVGVDDLEIVADRDDVGVTVDVLETVGEVVPVFVPVLVIVTSGVDEEELVTLYDVEADDEDVGDVDGDVV
jgi:hypothetical protein